MVAVLVAIPRQPCVRGLTAAPPEPCDRAGTIGDSSSALVDVINDVNKSTDKHLNKIHIQNQHLTICNMMIIYLVGIVENNTIGGGDEPLDVLVRHDFNEFKAHEIHYPLPGLPDPSFCYGGIVPEHLDNTTNTATNPGVLDGSIGASTPLHQRVLHQQHPHVACKSTSSSSLIYIHGINGSNDVVM
jgi:hypothetical protein